MKLLGYDLYSLDKFFLREMGIIWVNFEQELLSFFIVLFQQRIICILDDFFVRVTFWDRVHKDI